MASLVQDALDYAAEQTQQALAALGSSTTKETTVWMDGAFDVMHFGHANAFRQGRTLGTRLVVGVNSSSTIEQAKGARAVNGRLMRVHADDEIGIGKRGVFAERIA